jgi:hypothetical protein
MTFFYTVEIQGGLANRLRTLWATKAFAIKQQKPVLAIWQVLPELGCCWQSLLTTNTPTKLLTISQSSRLDSKVFSLCRLVFSTFGLGLNRATQPGIPWEHPPRYGDLKFIPFQWIQTCEEFESTTDVDPPFEPAQQLAAEARRRIAFIKEKHDSLIGIHIRRGDHVRSTKTSTLDQFKLAIQTQIANTDRSAFLVCTDSEPVATELKDQFGKRIFWFQPRSLNRSKAISIQDAMIDLLCLSKCDCLVGSHLSSFSILAAKYGNIPLQIAGESKSTNLGKYASQARTINLIGSAVDPGWPPPRV